MIGWLRPNPWREPTPPTVDIAGRRVPITIRRIANAKRMTMRLAPDGSEIRISLPRWGRTDDATQFVAQRKDWIERQLAVVPHRTPVGPGSTIAYRGQHLEVHWSAQHPRAPTIEHNCVLVGGAEDSIAARLRRWLEGEAKRLSAIDLAHYCNRAGVAVPALHLSRAERRWGSCSKRLNSPSAVRINWRLIQAPDAVRRSVVAHEVTHLVHFDHSPAFHALLRQVYDGDLAAADIWLREHGRTLYSTFG